MRAAMLTMASVGLTTAVIGNAWFQRQQFYPSVVYITKSNPSMAVIYIQALVMVVLMGKLMRKIFFGQLRAAEFEHLMERSWYAVTETCLAFTVFKDDFSPKFVALFTLLLFLKSFHWLAEERVDFMERSPVISLLFHLRVLSLAILLASLDGLFIQHAYHSTLTKGASVQLVFGFEYAILVTIVINTLVKYLLHAIDLHSENPWENKAVFMLYAELVIGFIKVLLYVLFFVIMVRIYTLPLFAVRPMYLTMRAFKKAFNDVVLSRRAIHNMNTLYPDATAEELAGTDNVCIICREEMSAPVTKKLPCNHIFHRNCLRSWFQRQQTCPTCRLDVLRNLPQQPTPAAARLQFPAAGAPQQQQAAFQHQIQQLRQQLDAMQQRGQVPQVPGMPHLHAMPQMPQIPGMPPMAQIPGMPPMAQFPGMPPIPQIPGMPPMGGGVAPPPPSSSAASSTTTPPTTGTAPSTGATAAGATSRPPMFLPPFPFLPFTVPPPLPPPNFQGLSDAELAQMEGHERQNVEARIKCLRNIQVLLDAAVMEMQQYSAVVAAHNTVPPSTVEPPQGAPPPPPSSQGGPPPSSSQGGPPPSSQEAAKATSQPSTNSTSFAPAAAFKTPEETGARPKSSSIASAPSSSTSSSGASLGAALERAASQNESKGVIEKKDVANGEIHIKEAGGGEGAAKVAAKEEVTDEPAKEENAGIVGLKNILEKEDTEKLRKTEENTFNALAEKKEVRSPEQEEIRKRRLAVFEEHKKRLSHQKS